MKYERHIRSTALQQRNRIVIVLIGITAPPINLYNSYRISNVFVNVILLRSFTDVNRKLQIFCR